MDRLNVKRGARVGLTMSFVLSASAAGSSATPVQTFVQVLALTLTVTLLTDVGLVAINRRPGTEAGPGVILGGFWIRAVAFGIDWLGLLIINMILFAAMGAPGPWVGTVIGIAYFIGCWRTTGQTIGMAAVGLRVVRDLDGGKLGWGSAALRLVCMVAAFACLYLGVVWVAFDERKRGWHDIVGHTRVIRSFS